MRPPISINSQRTQHQSYNWEYQGKNVTIAYETLGQGDTVLLLPAFSTVSSRTELAGIAQMLAPHFQVMVLDWLGFGESDRPPIHYNRSLYQQLLQDFVRDCCPHPLAIVAAGHASLPNNSPVFVPSCCSLRPHGKVLCGRWARQCPLLRA